MLIDLSQWLDDPPTEGDTMRIADRLDIYSVHDPSWHYRDPITVALVDCGYMDQVAS